MSRGLRRTGGALLSFGLAAVTARATYGALRRHAPGGGHTWERTNHRGEPVTLLEGPAVAVAAVAAGLMTPGLPVPARMALAAAGTGAAAFGGYDDLAGSADRRGFRGHLGALARGEVTSGTVKLAGICATGLAAGALAGGPASDAVINAGLAAGCANLINLFDLRPGRALKVTLAAGAVLGAASGEARAAVAAPMGAGLALLPEDLGEQAMLGDCGANALGAMLGVAAARLPRQTRLTVLVAVAGLTAVSERVSFSRVIDRTPALRWLDQLGRRTAPQGSPPQGSAPQGSAPPGERPGGTPPR